MDTKLATNQVRLAEWNGVIQNRCQSGLKVDDYCELHQISRNAYYYWLRKVKEAALSQNNFVKIQLPAETGIPIKTTEPTFAPQISISIGNLTIGINESTPMELLSKVLEVVHSVQ